LLILVKPKLVARLLASDFPSENPRTQTRNFIKVDNAFSTVMEMDTSEKTDEFMCRMEITKEI